jgi:hypothetical protein
MRQTHAKHDACRISSHAETVVMQEEAPSVLSALHLLLRAPKTQTVLVEEERSGQGASAMMPDIVRMSARQTSPAVRTDDASESRRSSPMNALRVRADLHPQKESHLRNPLLRRPLPSPIFVKTAMTVPICPFLKCARPVRNRATAVFKCAGYSRHSATGMAPVISIHLETSLAPAA